MMQGIRSGHISKVFGISVSTLGKVFVCVLLLGALPLWGRVTGTDPSYTLAASPAAPTVMAGGSAVVTLMLTSESYAGNVDFQIKIQEPLSFGLLAPDPVVLTSGGSGSTQFTIYATTSAAKHAPARPWLRYRKSGGAAMFCVLMCAPFGLRRKRVAAVALTALTISLAGFLVSCGGGGMKIAPRVYTMTVTPSGTGTVTDPAPLNIPVTVP
jgi:hypothetical protein